MKNLKCMIVSLSLIFAPLFSNAEAIFKSSGSQRPYENLLSCVNELMKNSNQPVNFRADSDREFAILFCETYSDSEIQRIVDFSKVIDLKPTDQSSPRNNFLAMKYAAVLFRHNSKLEFACASGRMVLEGRVAPYDMDTIIKTLRECRQRMDSNIGRESSRSTNSK